METNAARRPTAAETGPRWATLADWGEAVPAQLRAWLAEPGLLTARVRAAGGDAVALRLLGVRAAIMIEEWRRALGIDDAHCMLREVEFTAGARRWIFAQTVFPESTLERHAWLASLGGAGLGSTLAERADVKREPLRHARLTGGEPLLVAAGVDATAQSVLWARRAVYRIDGAPLLVQELFLPQLGVLD